MNKKNIEGDLENNHNGECKEEKTREKKIIKGKFSSKVPEC